MLGRRLPDILHRRADIQREIQLRACEALGRILENDLSVEILRVLLHQLRALNGDLLDLLAALIKHHVPLERGGGIVNVYDRLLDALDGIKGSLDQMLAALGEYLNHHVVGNQLALD